MRRLAAQVRALEREVERKLAQRKVMVVTGPAVIEVGRGSFSQLLRAEAKRPGPRPCARLPDLLSVRSQPEQRAFFQNSLEKFRACGVLGTKS